MNAKKNIYFFKSQVKIVDYIYSTKKEKIITLVKSVAVHSMNTFLVFKVILEWSPLIIGGKERTRPLLSVIIG